MNRMTPFFMPARPYLPGRVKGPVRIGAENARRDAIVVMEQHDLREFNGACSALAVIDGKPFSHALIRVQGHAIPCIIISREQAEQIPADTELVLDGQRGLLFDPQLSTEYPATQVTPPALFSPPASRDGERILLRASVSNRTGVMRALSCGASAIGLLRMEYLGARSRVPPDADFFTNELGACCNEAEPLPLIARLPDFTGAKLPDWCGALPHSVEQHDSRGVRLYTREPFKTLVKHILEGVNRCAEFYDLRLLLPFIDTLDEFIELRDQLRPQLSEMVAIGAMLETRHGVDRVERFLSEADFVAIGCNDFIADTLNCDREQDDIDPYHPAIYRHLQRLAQQAGGQTREIQLNGQLAHIPEVLPVLIGLGFRIFCVDPLLIPYLGARVKQVDSAEAARLAERVCRAADADQVKQLLGTG